MAKKSSRITQLRRQKRLRSNILRLLLRSLVWIGAAILYYSLFSLFFDTPFEYNLKESTARLRSEYEALVGRYDSLSMAIENVSERDRAIFRVLFESDPYEFGSKSEERRVRRYEELLTLSTEHLREELNSRVDDLTQCSSQLMSSSEKLVRRMESVGEGVNNIPAIQPIANKQLSLLTASYGMRIHPLYKTLQSHQGVDFTIPEGTRVFATADGVIKNFSLKNSTQGKTIVIDHGNGYETSYSHLSRVDIPRSRRVKRGETIGYSGNTGLSLIPHLHYEVRYNGMRVDPVHYFFGELSPEEYQRMLRIAQSGMQSFD